MPGTCSNYRSIVRGFLSYLHQQRGILKKNLAPLLIGAPQFAKAKPPKFLRPHQVQQLFESLSVTSPKNLRTYAMVHLAYTLGLQPCEICRITLDDIAFKKAQVSLEDRKNDQPLKLPIPEQTLKAIVAYMVGGRPNSKDRHLILSMSAPTANDGQTNQDCPAHQAYNSCNIQPLISAKVCKLKRGKKAIFSYRSPDWHLNNQAAFTSASIKFAATGNRIHQ